MLSSSRLPLVALAAAMFMTCLTAASASAEPVKRELWAPEEPPPVFLHDFTFGAEHRIGVTPRPKIGLGNFGQAPSYLSAINSNVRSFRQFRTNQRTGAQRQFNPLRFGFWRDHDPFMRFFGLDVSGDGKVGTDDLWYWLNPHGDQGGILSTDTSGALNRRWLYNRFALSYGQDPGKALNLGPGKLNIRGLLDLAPVTEQDRLVLLNELRNNLDRFLNYGGTAANLALQFTMLDQLGEIDVWLSTWQGADPPGLDDDLFPGMGMSFSTGSDGQVGGGGGLIIPEPASLGLLALGGLALLRRRR
jgi:hypothetical protein